MMIFACAMSISAQDTQGAQRNRGQGQGQGGQRRGFDQTEYFAQLKKDLNLNDKQVDSLKAISADQRTEMQKLFPRTNNGDGGGGNAAPPSEEDREARRAAMTKLQDKYNARIKKVLTDEQYKKYIEQQQAMRQRFQGGGPGGPGGQGGGPR